MKDVLFSLGGMLFEYDEEKEKYGRFQYDGPQIDEPAVILAPDGSELGSGMLQVHSPLRILYTDVHQESVSVRYFRFLGQNLIKNRQGIF